MNVKNESMKQYILNDLLDVDDYSEKLGTIISTDADKMILMDVLTALYLFNVDEQYVEEIVIMDLYGKESDSKLVQADDFNGGLL